jgi:hypothetical protein
MNHVTLATFDQGEGPVRTSHGQTGRKTPTDLENLAAVVAIVMAQALGVDRPECGIRK